MNTIVAVLLANAVLVLPIAIAAWATMRLFRRPAIAHALWVLALIKLITPPLISPALVVDPSRWPTLAAILPGAQVVDQSTAMRHLTATSDQAVHSIAAPQAAVASSVQADTPSSNTPVSTARYRAAKITSGSVFLVNALVAIWLTGSLFCICLFARRVRLVARLIRSSGKRDSMASALAESLFGVSLRQPPRVILVDAVISPTLIGVGPWTRILFPRRLWTELPASQRDGLLIHELEHFRRGDHWVRLVEAASTTLFWWHPVIWWARHHIEITEELCCDEVASRDDREMSYAEALLTTLDFINEPSWTPAVPVGTGVSRLPVLEQRLKQIVHHSIPGRLSMFGRIGLLGFAAVALPIQPLLLGGRIAQASSSLTLVPNPVAATTLAPPKISPQESSGTIEAIVNAIDLPPAPEGWWTQKPAQTWQHVSGDNPDAARLIVDATGSVQLSVGIDGKTIDLTSDGIRITAAAFWKSSKMRLITGDAAGMVRLWDVASGEPVSLLGRQQSEVTSLTIDDSGTLITGGSDGTLTSWDLQSGSRRATWTTDERPIQSVRLYDHGRRAVVIASDWRSASSRIVILNADTLEPERDWLTGAVLATTKIDDNQLTFVDWSGNLLRLNDQGDLEMFGSTAKDVVSAFVFSQDTRLENVDDDNAFRS